MPDLLCVHCQLIRGHHRAHTFQCPVGRKTKIGHLHYHPTNVFTPPGPRRKKQP